ncbi:MAG: tRNA (N6-isopentenyl adenosine(37)-C2)-methylthiotransferase MiaB [Oscillospiraceae bacterium]|jgi:tRNA-2-methylthio-N6-dimethylallyladenosine synthase|nr:tRNA (N6-isopentenyl adenosine(37)-C2)-methylthiotransferase MiaB [Oscillospiraceae bacterium]
MSQTKLVSPEELARQDEYAALLHEYWIARRQEPPRAFVHTYGCQGNEADSERLRGLLARCGFGFCNSAEEADLALFNTCAVREHAEDRVFGNVGRLKGLRQTRGLRIALCGCMVQQAHVAEKLRRSFPFVDLVFGTHALHRLPELLYQMYAGGRRVFEIADTPGEIAEGLPLRRDSAFKAWLPIMYGCDNFCSYCVVPLVRGRERSRAPEVLLEEARGLVAAGYKEITLLGQNVNSYRSGDYDFPRLLRELDAIEGDFWLRFMTSHPKDCSPALLETMAAGRHIARHLHLPVQCGSDRVLAAMNRGYTQAQYLALAALAREYMPDLRMTSDIIVGFPGETYEEFRETLTLVDAVGYASLFTFLYSPREGTRAAAMPDPVPHAEKVRWFQELTALQEAKAAAGCAALPGKILRLLCETPGKRQALAGRSEGSQMVEFDGPTELIGQFVHVRVTKARGWLLDGERILQESPCPQGMGAIKHTP